MNRTRWIPWSAAFATLSLGAVAGVLAGSGCQARCERQSDCGPGAFCAAGQCTTECFSSADCRVPPACMGNPAGCTPKALYCSPRGQCVGPIHLPRGGDPEEIEGSVARPPEGWGDDPGSGQIFVLNQIAIAPRGRGFDLDGQCDTAGCVDNDLWRVGELGNDQIQQGLLTGETIMLLELSGLDADYRGEDSDLTVKLYGGRDVDPFFPDDNFRRPPGATTCCEFELSAPSLFNDAGGQRQARARAPAQIDGGRLTSLAPVPLQVVLSVGPPPHVELDFEQALVSGRVPADLSEFAEGLLGAAIPTRSLLRLRNPYCRAGGLQCPVAIPGDSTLLDLVTTLIRPQPDIDLDLDGLECVLDTDGDGHVDRCCDGAAGQVCSGGISSCPGRIELASPDPADPGKCGLSLGMADGYSVALAFSGVPAHITNVAR